MCLIRSIEAHKKNIPKREQSRDKKENNGSSTGSAHERGCWRRKLCKQLSCSGILTN